MADKIFYYILLQDRLGFKTSKSYSFSSKKNDFKVIKGEILCSGPAEKQSKDMLNLVSLDRCNVTLTCSVGDVGRVEKEEAFMLLAISSQGERYKIFTERGLILDAALKVQEGETIIAKVSKSKDAKGTIWYKGPIDDTEKIFFGVELTEKSATHYGTCDGTYKGNKYFTCPANNGIFVALDKILKFIPQSKMPKRKQKLREHFLISEEKLVKEFPVDTRVVVFTDDFNSSYRGTLRYVGRPTAESELLAGIELDDPAGEGNGEYYGQQLFVCNKDCARFEALANIMKEDKFDEGESSKKTSASSCSYPSKEDRHKRTGSDSESSVTSSVASSDLADISVVMGMSKEELLTQSKQVMSDVKQEKQFSSLPPEHLKEGLQSRYNEENIIERRHRLSSRTKPVVDPQQGILHMQGAVPSCRVEMPQMTNGVEQSLVLSRGSAASSVASQAPINIGGSPLIVDAKNRTALDSRIHSEYSPTDIHNGPTELKEERDAAVRTSNPSATLRYPPQYTPLYTKSAPSLEVDSLVVVSHIGSRPYYGVIRWIGRLSDSSEKLLAGVELDEEIEGGSDGKYGQTRVFQCPPRRGHFTWLSNLQKDTRFQDGSKATLESRVATDRAFGSIESPVIKGVHPPPAFASKDMLGQRFGIQGHHNSCYLDATLYSMFAFSPIFDSMLHRPRCDTDLVEFTEVQSVLRDCIVNPLRRFGFVRADKVLQLRRLLDKLGSTSGLISEEKDPEEFLSTLFHQVFKMEPLLHLKSAGRMEGAFFYQMFTEKDNTAVLPTVQQLLEQSFINTEVRLGDIPSCLILQMPRYGNRYKMYNRILPNLTLDITKIVENVPHECHMCGKLARNECKDCFVEKSFGEHAVIAHFCDSCFVNFHGHRNRTHHKKKPLPVPRDYPVSDDDGSACVNYYMDLFAVVCIETSHYVAFVKCGTGKDAQWVFFDSMADRKGEKDGYNIPCISPCPEIFEWIEDRNRILQTSDKEMPELMRRLFGDAYLCMYQNLEMGMYQ